MYEDEVSTLTPPEVVTHNDCEPGNPSENTGTFSQQLDGSFEIPQTSSECYTRNSIADPYFDSPNVDRLCVSGVWGPPPPPPPPPSSGGRGGGRGRRLNERGRGRGKQLSEHDKRKTSPMMYGRSLSSTGPFWTGCFNSAPPPPPTPPPPQALSPPPGLPPPDPAIAPSPPPGPQVVHFIQDVPKSFGLIVNNSFEITLFSIPKGTRIETADEKFKFNHIYKELSNDEIEKFDIGIGYTITASQTFNLTFEGPPISDSETLQISLKKGKPTSFSPYTNKNITNALNISEMDSSFTVYISKDGEVCEYTSETLRSAGSLDNCNYTEFKREVGYTLLANKDFVLQI